MGSHDYKIRFPFFGGCEDFLSGMSRTAEGKNFGYSLEFCAYFLEQFSTRFLLNRRCFGHDHRCLT